MKYWSLFFSIVIFVSYVSNQSSNVTLYEYNDEQNMIVIESEDSIEPKPLKLKKYYFAYHIFNTLLFDTTVFIGLDVTDAYEFISTIYTHLSTENELIVKMKNKNNKTYKFLITLSDKELIIRSSPNKEKFII